MDMKKCTDIAERTLATFKKGARADVPWADIEVMVAERLLMMYKQGLVDGLNQAMGIAALRGDDEKGIGWDEGYCAGANDKTDAIQAKIEQLQSDSFMQPSTDRGKIVKPRNEIKYE